MLIAEEKKKTNIAEYVIYMWQVEELIRSSGLDIDKLNENVVSQYQVDDATKIKIRNWYEGLIDLMRVEKIEQHGHFGFLEEIITRLNALHLKMLKDPETSNYQQIYLLAKPNLSTFRKKHNDYTATEIVLCFNALYGLFCLRLQQKEVSNETKDAIATFSKLIAFLTAQYHKEYQ